MPNFYEGGIFFRWLGYIKFKVVQTCLWWGLEIPIGKPLMREQVRAISKLNVIKLCKSHGERMTHLFLHCAVAQEFWSLIFCLFGIS